MTDDLRERLRALQREMGTVVSVLLRKTTLTHDEHAQVTMVNKWQSELDAVLAAAREPQPVQEAPNLDFWESRIEWYRSASKVVDDLPDDTADDGEPTQDYVMSGDLAKDAADDLEKAVVGWDKSATAREPQPTQRECWHGHKTRQVGCVSCVIVFDRPAESAAARAQPSELLIEGGDLDRQIQEWHRNGGTWEAPAMASLIGDLIAAVGEPVLCDACGRELRDDVNVDQPLQGIRDAKYLNPQCAADGCQWLNANKPPVNKRAPWYPCTCGGEHNTPDCPFGYQLRAESAAARAQPEPPDEKEMK